MARDWVVPGTPGLEHRIGGLEKDFTTGNVSYDPDNHERMSRVRADKIQRITRTMPPLDLAGDTKGDVLVVGWGGTFGALRQATDILRGQGHRVSHVHLRYVHPLHPQLGSLLRGFSRVLVAELNLGQLSLLLRASYLVDARGLNKIKGKPFKVQEVVSALTELLGHAATGQSAAAAK